MNVETIRKMQDSSERYSFKAHAAGDWSLEHIHAQNAEPLNTAEQWTAWLRVPQGGAGRACPASTKHHRASLLDRIDEVLSGQVTQQAFSALEKDLTAVFSPDDGAGR